MADLKAKPRGSMRAAINAKCRDCAYDPLDRGTWRAQVGRCAIVTCSLHPFRPQPTARRGHDEEN